MIKETHKTYLNWSSGKDAAMALYYLLKDRRYKVHHLLTNVNAHYKRVSMHDLRRELLLTNLTNQQITQSTIPHVINPGLFFNFVAIAEKIRSRDEEYETSAAVSHTHDKKLFLQFKKLKISLVPIHIGIVSFFGNEKKRTERKEKV